MPEATSGQQHARPANAPVTVWDVDLTHSQVGFSVRHLMVSNVKGRFRRFQASVRFDEKDPARSSVEATIEAASIDTDLQQRDDHLRSPDFLDASAHPTLSFRSTRVVPAGEAAAQVHGELTIRGVTRPVVLAVERDATVDDPWGNTRTAFTGTTTIDRRDWGLNWNGLLEAGGVVLGEKVRIELHIEAVLRRVDRAA